MSDLIYRQKVIDALDDVINNGVKNKYVDEHFITAEAMREYILAQPSAQPEIIRCKDCKYHRYEGPIPCCTKIDYGYGWTDDDFCSYAERREDECTD